MIDQAVGCNTARVIKWSWSTIPYILGDRRDRSRFHLVQPNDVVRRTAPIGGGSLLGCVPSAGAPSNVRVKGRIPGALLTKCRSSKLDLQPSLEIALAR